MAIELVHAKLNRGEDLVGDTAYMMDFVFGSPFIDGQGKHVGKAKTIHMSFKNGMPPEDFVEGLKALAQHIEETVIKSDDFKEKPVLVVDNNSG